MSDSLIRDPHRWLEVVPATLRTSALYTELWQHLKGDPELLALLNLVDVDQPIPITFFTTVNYLVLREPMEPWAVFYPYLNPDATPPLSEAYRVFKTFVLERRETLQSLLPTARLQTNEVTRCANLLPAFMLAYQRGGGLPLSMIEIGSSMGLHLLWNHYHYTYTHQNGQDIYAGRTAAPVRIRCTSETPTIPFSLLMLPRVAHIKGIECCPRSLNSPEDVLWVQAAIWPEEVDRYRLLNQALSFAWQNDPLPLINGDACDHLPRLLAEIPADCTAVVWHSYALNQGPIQVKTCISQQMAEASRQRPIYRISLECVPSHDSGPYLELSEYQGGEVTRLDRLAACSIHGERMTWLYNGALL